jgi:hypothetical protein
MLVEHLLHACGELGVLGRCETELSHGGDPWHITLDESRRVEPEAWEDDAFEDAIAVLGSGT